MDHMMDMLNEYMLMDIAITDIYAKTLAQIKQSRIYNPGIKKVIFNPPATIVIWMDGLKTVVKCRENDAFDPEKGLAMAISKRLFGNKGAYYEEFKKWLPKEEEVGIKYCSDCKHAYDIMCTGLCFGCAKMWNNTALPDYWAPKEEKEENK